MFKHGVLRGLRSVVEVEETPPLPHFPGRPDTMVTGEAQLEERRALLENYLNQVRPPLYYVLFCYMLLRIVQCARFCLTGATERTPT